MVGSVTGPRFARRGAARAVEVDGRIVAAAFASFVIGRRFEPGIETLPVHRGAGHVARATAALIRHCLQAGFEPIWSCRLDNAGSCRLAARLGFEPTHRIACFRLPRRV